jgi:multicomponent Na+:H+ antiporter subunit B
VRHDLVLRVIAKIMIPFILLFAVYVQFHGDYGPGGGFQAGVIIAAAIIFHGVIFGLDTTRRVVPSWLVETMLAAGVLIYAGVGIVGLLLGGNYLDYFVLDRDSVHGQERGIFWVEVGVAVTVSGVMLKIFYMFGGRGQDPGRRLQPPQLFHHRVPDGGGAVHRHRPRQSHQEARRARDLPDLGVPALHRAGEAHRRHRADHRPGIHRY